MLRFHANYDRGYRIFTYVYECHVLLKLTFRMDFSGYVKSSPITMPRIWNVVLETLDLFRAFDTIENIIGFLLSFLFLSKILWKNWNTIWNSYIELRIFEPALGIFERFHFTKICIQ